MAARRDPRSGGGCAGAPAAPVTLAKSYHHTLDTHMRRFLLSALTLAPMGAALAQRDTARIAPVAATGARIPINALSSPATIDVVTGDELRTRGITSIAAALQSVPGLTFAQNGSFGATTSLFLRGGESKYVKVLVDGVPINDPGGAID